MARNLSANQMTHILSDRVSPYVTVELDFPDGPVRASSLPFDITLGGHVYYGVGILGDISSISEGAEQRSYGVSVKLSGIPLSFVEYISSQRVQGRPMTIGLGFTNENEQLIGSHVVIGTWLMDTLDIAVGKQASVSIAGESLMIDWERPRMRRFTDADQKAHYPGDRGLEHVAEVASKEMVWGRT